MLATGVRVDMGEPVLVADEVPVTGYGSGRAFSAMFRRLLGENPREYVASLGLLATLEKG